MRTLPLIALLLCVPAPIAASGTTTVDLVRAALVEEARRQLPATVVDVDVFGLRLDHAVQLPPGDAEVRIRAKGGTGWSGKVTFEVDLVSGDFAETVGAKAELTLWTRVAVLSRPVARGQQLDAGAVEVVSRPEHRSHVGVLRMEDLLGRTARRDLGLGALVHEKDLEERIDAKRRSPVRLRMQGGGLTVQTEGVLNQDARIGDTVVVRVRDSGIELPGTLLDKSTVLVDLGAGGDGSML